MKNEKLCTVFLQKGSTCNVPCDSFQKHPYAYFGMILLSNAISPNLFNIPYC